MPKYQMIFETKEGEAFFTVDIDHDESLDGVLTEILADLHDKGRILKGWQDGVGEVVCKWEGRELRKNIPLPEQHVKAKLSSVAGEAPLTQTMPGANATAESVRSEVGYIPAIEGLRGVAVLWVVVFHYATVRDPRFECRGVHIPAAPSSCKSSGSSTASTICDQRIPFEDATRRLSDDLDRRTIASVSAP